jgi:hypothetical protein
MALAAINWLRNPISLQVYVDKASSRAFPLEGTEYAQAYAGAEPPWWEQWKRRDPTDSMKGPFWSNYWYEPCRSCDCRIGAPTARKNRVW